ncbi:MAG: hypothetical protein IJZ35_00715 [Clostridia bacterium]|nr:hypothetical protein [Clostridia bacterium]
MLGTIVSFLRPYLVTLTAAITSITMLICPTLADTDSAEIVNENCYSLVDAFIMGQGLDTYDGYYYTSGSIAAVQICSLAIVDINSGEIVTDVLDALPQEFKDKDYDHIGDISVQNGIIYAPVEDKAEEQPLVLLYDAETLEYKNVYYELDATYLTDGIPWCATDENYLYTSEFNNPERIVVYNIDDMSPSHTVELAEPLARVQSGDVLDGTLYLNCDPEEGNKNVYSVDLTTGDVTLVFDRNTTGFETETEGLCAETDKNGELIFHISDYNKLVSTFIRTYKLK